MERPQSHEMIESTSQRRKTIATTMSKITSDYDKILMAFKESMMQHSPVHSRLWMY